MSSLGQANKVFFIEEYNVGSSCSLSRNVWKITWFLYFQKHFLNFLDMCFLNLRVINVIIFMKYDFKLNKKTIKFHAYCPKVPDLAFRCETANKLLKILLVSYSLGRIKSHSIWLSNLTPKHSRQMPQGRMISFLYDKKGNKKPYFIKALQKFFNFQQLVHKSKPVTLKSRIELKTTKIITLDDAVSALIQPMRFHLFI